MGREGNPILDGRKRQRYRFVQETEKKRKSKKLKAFAVRCLVCLHYPLLQCQKFLEKLGMFIGRHPKSFAFVTFLILTFNILGILRLRKVDISGEFFSPVRSKSTYSMETLEKRFGSVARRQEIILLPISGTNVLNKKCLREALKIHNVIINITGFQTICVKNKNKTKDFPCKLSTPLEALDFEPGSINNFVEVLSNKWKKKRAALSDVFTPPYGINEILSKFRVDEKGTNHTFSAAAMKMIYYLKQPKTALEKNLVQAWEIAFISQMKSIEKNTSCSSVYFYSDGDGDRELLKIFSPKILPFVICVPSLLVLTLLILKLFTVSRRSVCLFVLAVFCISLSVLSSASFGFLVGYPFSNAIIIPFAFLTGKGVSDAFLIIYEIEKEQGSSLLHQIGGCVSRIGLIFTNTALFSAVLYGFTLFSPFYGIRDSYFFALVATLIGYFISTSFILACSIICLRQCSSSICKGRCLPFMCCHKSQKILSTDSDADIKPNKRRQDPCVVICGRFLTSKLSKMIVVLITVGIIVCCIYIHTVSEAIPFRENTDFSTSLYYRHFKAINTKYFGEMDVSIIFNANIHYENVVVQKDLLKISQHLSQRYDSHRNASNWLTSLIYWSRKSDIKCIESQFYVCLRHFLAIPGNDEFRKDIKFVKSSQNATSIAESRIRIHLKYTGKFGSDIEQMETLRQDIASFRSYLLVAASRQFFPLDMLLTFKGFCLKTVIVIGLALLLCSQLLCASFRVGILLFASFSLHVEEIIVLSTLWNVPWNPVSYLCILIGLMIALYFDIEVVQVLSVSPEKTVEERTVTSIRLVGPCIIVGILITVACSISLAFIFPHLSTIFLYIYPAFWALSFFHSLALLPTIMLLSSKLAEAFAKKLALEESLELKDLSKLHREQLWEVKWINQKPRASPRHQTVSVIGIGCRYPQAENKDKFWEMLIHGQCAISTFPSNRPEEYDSFQALYHPKRFVTKRLCTVAGAFMEKIRCFDAAFFKISPQEARAMDPQQRILLQVVYEAIEDAGLRLEDLQQCRTGVFVGAMNLEYSDRLMKEDNRANMDQFYSTGSTASILANRISFCLDFTGPSLTVDTACSSSLTALKIAQEFLFSGQCDIAIVCAPNVILDEAAQITFSIGGLLAPDGRCKCFDASGDGYGRGEGFAAVVLKPTEVSLSDNDDVYCEILACGTNNDGQNAIPITAPSPKMQAELSTTVLEEAGLNAADIGYVEAHGTGTAIGDVVETASIAETYCGKAAGKLRTLRIGSVKSNLNHTESASGLTGLIKVSLMIKNKMFVPTINIKKPNPKLKLSQKGIKVQEECEDWITTDGKLRTAAVNSFGYGGSNVHAILREIEPKKLRPLGVSCCTRNIYMLTLSARSEDALRNIAKQFGNSWLREQPEEAEFKLNLCYSLIERRSQYDYRLAVLFNTFADASSSLQSFADNSLKQDSRVVSGIAKRSNQNIVFVFGGQGSNWCGMAAQLIESEPVFQKAIVSVSDLIKDLGENWSLLEELAANDEKSRLMGNTVGQPATFAIQYATVKLLESWGILPSAVIGHSLGEIAAACTAGALTLKESLKLILTRSKWHEKCSARGSMAALGLSEEQAHQLIADLKLQNSLSVAAVNDYKNVTVSGDRDAVQCIEDHLKQSKAETFWKVLPTPRAFHSFYIDVVKKPFQEEVKSLQLKPKSTQIPMYSTVLGDRVNGKQLHSEHWWRNMRDTVLFYDALTNSLKEGHRITIEIGPQPVLRHYIHKIATEVNRNSKDNILQMSTLPHKLVKQQHEAFLKNTVCTLYTVGYPVHWVNVLGECSHQLVRFPPYPWQEKDYWYRNQPPSSTIRSLEAAGPMHNRHPFLTNVRLTEPFSGVQCWETEIDLHKFPTFKDHVLIQGGPVLPGSACIEMAIAMAADRYQYHSGIEIKDVIFTNLLTLPETQVRLLRLRLENNEIRGNAKFSVCNVQDDGSEMPLALGNVVVNCTTNVSYQACMNTKNDALTKEYVLDSSLQETILSMTEIPLSTFRRLTELLGFNYGPDFSLVRRIWRHDNKALCALEMDSLPVSQIGHYIIHPALVDACLQTSIALEDISNDTIRPSVPIGVRKILVLDPHIPRRTYCHVTNTSSGSSMTYDMKLVDARGKVYITLEQFQLADVANFIRTPKVEDVSYRPHWIESQIPMEARDLSKCGFIVFKDSRGVGSSFIASLTSTSSAKVIGVDLPESTEPNDVEECIKSALSTAIDSALSELTVVNFWPLEASYLVSELSSINRSQELAFMSSSQVLNSLIENQSNSSRVISQNFIIVTCCAQIITGDEKKFIPWASTAWGMRRTASLEIPSIRSKSVDLSEANKKELNLLVQELKVESSDDEIALRDGKRFVNRLKRLSSEPQSPTNEKSVDDLEMKHPAPLYLGVHPQTGKICLREETERACVSDEDVEVQVTNIWAPFSVSSHVTNKHSQYFGFSGVVKTPAKCGNMDVNLKTGDHVMGVSNQRRLGDRTVVNRKQVVAKPDQMSPQQGATLPSCLALASYALQQVSSDNHGAVVLIHEANRDLGLAGLLLAQAMGYSVICTSSDPRLESSKRYLKALGATEVLDAQCTELEQRARDLAVSALFFYEPLANSVTVSCNVLKPGGKLIVLGGSGSGHIAIPSDRSVIYHGITYSDVLDSHERFQELWTSSLALLKSNEIFDLLLQIEQQEISVFDFLARSESPQYQGGPSLKANVPPSRLPRDEEIETSFCSFSFEAREKLRNIELLPAGLDQYGMKRDRTYMVVGGVRGFGFEVARWMAYKGAGTIVLVARSPPSDAKLGEIQALENDTGTKIKIFQADVSSQEQMNFLHTNELSKLPSVAGIVLTAMVLHDQFITQLDRETFFKVIAPKVTGAFVLHEMSRKMDLDFFVMFSSLASLLGNPGQASYSAANAFLDSLAHYRRKVLHLPAVSINWGPIEGAGVLQRQENIGQLLARAGYRTIDARKGMTLMEQILIEEPLLCQVGVFDVDWSRVLESSAGLKKTTSLLPIKDELEASITDKDFESLGPRILMEADQKKKYDMVTNFITELISSWMGISTSELDLNTSLYNYGLDSFFALTFKMQLESALQVSFEVFYFMQPDTTPFKVVEDIMANFNKNVSNETSRTSSGDTLAQFKTEDTEITETETYPKDESCPTATYQIVPLYKPDQAAVNFFCIHPAGRYAMNLVPISTGFFNQSLIAFFAIGYTDPTMTGDARSVRQLGQSYVTMIKQVQKHGPYFLGGQSFGGLVAYEMASILVEKEEEVAFVAMIDTFPWEMENRSGPARLEHILGGRMLDHLMQATFEQVLARLASQSLRMTSKEYTKARETKTQEETIEFLQNRARQLDIPLYDIRKLKESLEQDSLLASNKHGEWKPAAVYYKGPLTFLKCADQRFTPVKPLQESADDAWSLIVEGNIDVYVCPGDHLALGEVKDAMVTGRILAAAIGMRYRTMICQLPRLQQNYKQKKAIRKFHLGVDVFLHSRKGLKPPKYGKLLLQEEEWKLVFRPTLVEKTDRYKKGSAAKDKEGNPDKVFDLIDVQMVLPGKHVAVTVKRNFQQRMVHGHQTGNHRLIVAMVMASRRVRNFELLDFADFKEFFTLFKALFGVAFDVE